MSYMPSYAKIGNGRLCNHSTTGFSLATNRAQDPVKTPLDLGLNHNDVGYETFRLGLPGLASRDEDGGRE